MAAATGKVLSLRRGLLAVRPKLGVSSTSLVAGNVLRLDDGQRAAVLCWRSGLCFAALPAPAASAVVGSEVVYERGESIMLGAGSALGGRIIDCLGSPLDGLPPPVADDVEQWPLLGPVPAAAELKPIHRSLHTGTAAIDALTPLGCGQSLLLIGREGAGQTAVGWDAVLAQARAADMHPVLALSRGGAARGVEALEWLRDRGEHALADRTTVVATREADGASATERALVAAAASAVAEQTRTAGRQALLLLDDFSGVCDVWDAAGEAVEQHGASYAGATDRHIERSEQRIFYASYLQRVAQMSDERGGGSLTLLATLEQPPPPASAARHATFGTLAAAPAEPAAASATAAAADDDDGAGADAAAAPPPYGLDEFASHSETEQHRVKLLLERGVHLDATVLRRIGIRPPKRPSDAGGSGGGSGDPAAAAESTAAAAAAAASPEVAAAKAAELAYERSLRHIDQLTSLADGHVQLHAAMAADGHHPALEPAECLARVGAGTDTADRPQPSTAAMRAVASNLRLELTLARDMLPGAQADAHAEQQRTRAAAYRAVLCAQPAGAPLRLSEQIALLLALEDGKLDGLASEPPAAVAPAVRRLLERAADAAPAAMAAVDATGELGDDDRQQLREAVEVLPGGSARRRRAFFGTWDSSTPDAEDSFAARARGKLK